MNSFNLKSQIGIICSIVQQSVACGVRDLELCDDQTSDGFFQEKRGQTRLDFRMIESETRDGSDEVDTIIM